MRIPPPDLVPWREDVDFDHILDEYGLVVKPIPDKSDPGRRWCAAPYCRNDARPRGVLCKPHAELARVADWTVADLIARELMKSARPGAGCANPACPTSEKKQPSSVPTTARMRQFAVRRFYGRFRPGGEYLCRVCSAIVNEVAPAFDPEFADTATVAEKVMVVARRAIPHATYEKLTGQILMRSRKVSARSLTVADGYTLDQWVLGLGQYAGFWATIMDERFILRTRGVDELETAIQSVIDGAELAVENGIAEGELPDYALPYSPGRVVIDAMLSRFPRGA